jgi:hypothetical protein
MARLLRAGLTPESYIPPVYYQALRDLARARLSREATHAKNELLRRLAHFGAELVQVDGQVHELGEHFPEVGVLTVLSGPAAWELLPADTEAFRCEDSACGCSQEAGGDLLEAVDALAPGVPSGLTRRSLTRANRRKPDPLLGTGCLQVRVAGKRKPPASGSSAGRLLCPVTIGLTPWAEVDGDGAKV